ncbi:cadherin-like beta sandwich domain-containing protein [Pedobacter metabolipauper]|nr:cadherin-like beta sandwich domain-containing protein [Pedobacter metabolipauper]
MILRLSSLSLKFKQTALLVLLILLSSAVSALAQSSTLSPLFNSGTSGYKGADYTFGRTTKPNSINATRLITQKLSCISNTDPTYGDTDYAPVMANSGLPVRYSSDNDAVISIVNNKIKIVGAGRVNITASQEGDAIYLPASITKTINVAPLQVTVTANAQTKVYGNNDPELTYTITSGALLEGDTFTGSLNRDGGVNVGEYTINRNTLALNVNYTLTFVSAKLSITKRPLTIHPISATKIYGNSDPSLPYSFDGTSLAPNEAMTGLFGRTLGENAGTYALTLGTKRPVSTQTFELTSDNYDISFISNNLTVTPRSIGLYAYPISKEYGDADPELTVNTFLVGTDKLSGSLVRTPGEDAGTYTINQGTLMPPSSNYTYTFTGASFTINKKIITVTANAQSKLYLDTEPELSYEATTLPFNEIFNGSLTRAPGEDAGSYAITQGTLALSDNYTLNFTGADLQIDKRLLRYTADPATRFFGDNNPAFTGTVTGFVNGENLESATTGNLLFSSTETSASPIGIYAINGSGLAAKNYDFMQHSSNDAALSVVLSSDNTLSSFTAHVGTLTSTFESSQLSYVINVTGSYVVLSGTLSSPHATATINGKPFISNDFETVPLQPGSNALEIIVTAQDESTRTYQFTINRNLSGNNRIGALYLGHGNLSPSFNSETLNYTATVSNAVSSISVSSILADTSARVTVNGAKVTENGGLSEVGLLFGENLINVLVRAENGDERLYTVLVTRPISSDATLATLGTSSAISPAFSAAVTDYTATVPSSIATYSVTPGTNHESAILSISLNGMPLASEATAIPLQIGLNNIVILVTAQDSVTTKTYRIQVNRVPSNVATANVSVVGTTKLVSTAGTGYKNYLTSINVSATSIQVKAALDNKNASVTINGEPAVSGVYTVVPLLADSTLIDVLVTAEDGITQKSYTIKVKRTGMNIATAKVGVLGATKLVSITGPGYVNYLTSINVRATSIQVKAALDDKNASVTINGEPAISGEYTVVPLLADSTLIDVLVTAENGITQKSYTITVKRTGLNIATANLGVLGATKIVSTTGPGYMNYVTYLNVGANSIQVKAALDDKNATVTINGEPAVSGEYATVPLLADSTLINVLVTAEDGSTQKSYTIAVKRTGMNIATAKVSVLGTTKFVSTTGSGYMNYLTSININATSIKVRAALDDKNASVTINGEPAVSGEYAVVPLLTDSTLINVLVTAENGIAQKSYTITVKRTGMNIATADINVLGATKLVSTTGPGYVNYLTSINVSATSIQVKAALDDDNARVTINGEPAVSGVYALVPLLADSTLIDVLVTAENGIIQKSYTIKVKRTGMNIATAKVSVLGATKLVSITGPGYVNYLTSINVSATSIQVKAALDDKNASVTINGEPAISGEYTVVPLLADSTLIDVLVTAENGATQKSYTITVKRTGLNIATANLGVLGATKIVSTTGPGYMNYLTYTNISATSIQVKAALDDENASVTINGEPAVSGEYATVPLLADSTLIYMLVTAEDGITQKSYTIAVKRTGTNIATAKVTVLGTTKLVSTTGSGYMNYLTSININATSIKVRAALGDKNASVTINGEPAVSGVYAVVPLLADSTLIDVLVTAENGIAQKSYTITVKRTGMNIATAKVGVLAATKLVSTTGPGYVNYLTSINVSATSIQVKAALDDENASVTINGEPAVSGVYSLVPLLADSTLIDVLVTAENGITQKSYTITVKRTGMNIATAKVAVLGGTKLISIPGSGYINYLTSINLDATSIQVKAALDDKNAKVTVNGEPAVSGAYSIVPLLSGSTLIDVLVTAENGITQKSYIIIVERMTNDSVIIPARPVMLKEEFKQTTITNLETQNAKTKLLVHQGLTPNGDGINDYLQIDAINDFPENNFSIVNSNGMLVYQTKEYGKDGNIFNGYSNNGSKLVPGTYYYILEYKDGKAKNKKTGYIILKY